MTRLVTSVPLELFPVDQALAQVADALSGRTGPIRPITITSADHSPALDLPLDPLDDDPDDPIAVILATSGSTGTPREVLLPGSAMTTVAHCTHQFLLGPGNWLLALPLHHIGGLQVLVRSLVAGTTPGTLSEGGSAALGTSQLSFTANHFTAAARRLMDRTTGEPRYVSLVPTQVVRLLGDPAATDALASFDAVLVGGAPLPEPTRSRADAAGIRLINSYGSTETSGGVIYDGVPLAGVQVAIHQGQICVGGPTIARGYRGQSTSAHFSVDSTGTRWFHSSDLGDWLGDSPLTKRLIVHGRADDVLISGGVNVSPHAVEAALAKLPGVDECLVVGVPDAQWGDQIVALMVGTPPPLADIRRHIREQLGPAAAPRAVHVLPQIPHHGPGKPDRTTASALARRLAKTEPNE
ncbi:MAG: AMP-binding protein [Actinomycetota bacterium]